MSAGDNHQADHEDERESWKDLFGSVFEAADELTTRITPDEIEAKLKDIRRRAGRNTAGRVRLMVYRWMRRRWFAGRLGVKPAADGWDDHRRPPARPEPTTRAESPDPESLTSADLMPRTSPPAPVRPAGFWGALDPTERLTFQRLAGRCRYAAGDVLMREGDTADHVVVILEGQTQISVRNGTGQRVVVAQRGPGELIGERAALQVNVRSATVTAIEPLVAMVMRTQDFAAFISAHPAVLKIIEAMVYERLREAGYRPAEPATTEYPGLRQYPKRSVGSLRRLAGQQCTVIAANVVGLDALVRNDEDRQFVRGVMMDITRLALTDMWKKCFLEDRADGMVIAVPAAVPTLGIVERLTSSLPTALRRHNRIYNVCAQIQMRIAVETGPVHSQGRGLTGKALDRARQLLETPALINTINSSRANLGMIVSSSVYDTTIRPLGAPVRYQPVRIEGMGLAQQPWMQMIDPAPEQLAV
jgi:CRP-like cAMP-binding protein